MQQESLQKSDSISIISKLNAKLKSENYGKDAPKGTNHYSFEIALMEAIQSHTLEQTALLARSANVNALPRPSFVIFGCTNIRHNDIDCNQAGINVDEWCETCKKAFLPRPDTTVLKQVLEENTDMDSDLKGALNSIIQDSLAPHINASKEKKREAELYFEMCDLLNKLYAQYEFQLHKGTCYHPEFALHYKCMFTYPSETEHILDCIIKELSEGD